VNKKRAQENVDRRAKLAALQAQQRSGERRRNALIFGAIIAVAVAIIVAVTIVIVGQVQKEKSLEEAAGKDIEGVQTYDIASQNHTEDPVQYEQTPPVGGDHKPIWLNCGVYTEPVEDTNAVHSLEHGAVWVTYQPELAKDQVDALTELVGDRNHVILSPHPEQESPVMASAWGLQLGVDSAEDERLETFLAKYVQGEQTPEPGATCSGGVDG
jgi:hypothetical protein